MLPLSDVGGVKSRLPAYAILLAGIFLELMLAPVLVTGRVGLAVAFLLGGVTLLAALFAVGARRIAVVLFVPTLFAQLAAVLLDIPWLSVGAVLVRMLFLLYVFVLLLQHVLQDSEVGWNTVAGAVNAYLVLGVAWGDLFLLLEKAQPGSFRIPVGFPVETVGELRAALLYFSFLTLTTVGYGDITPANAGIGGVCMAEAIVGQLYLAIMIARMVGLHLVARAT